MFKNFCRKVFIILFLIRFNLTIQELCEDGFDNFIQIVDNSGIFHDLIMTSDLVETNLIIIIFN